MTQTPATNRIGELTRALLDRGYEQAARATLNAIAAAVTSGVVAQRLRELDAEAARLVATSERLQPDNPVLRALLADLELVLQRNALEISAGASLAQSFGISAAGQLTRELALPGVTAQQLAAAGVQWRLPSPEAVNALVGYVNSVGWAQEVARYPNLVLDTVINQAIRGFVEGWGPARTAREIRRMTEGVSVAQANNLIRTVQLVSFRDATAIHQAANADILTGSIRIATLDARTCLCCIALHGTRLAVGERVLDHHMGRCTSISEVRGRPRSVQTGVDWFAGLPEDRRREIAGNSAFELLATGRAQLQDFVETYRDPVFGEMLRTASVKGVLVRAG